MPRPLPTHVYHMVHIDRLASIIEQGLLCDNEVRNRGLAGTEIGYAHIKQRRAARPVPCGGGGTLADYVPFYFAPRSPMLYAITRGNVSSEAAATAGIVYLITTTQELRGAGLCVVCSNRHAELAYATLSASDSDLDGDEFIDWPLMRQQMWNNTPEFPDRRERRQAECLVLGSVPWSALQGIATRTDEAKELVEGILDEHGQRRPVDVRRDWYF